MDQLLKYLNSGYVKLIRKTAKWLLIIFGVTVLGLGVGAKFVSPNFMQKTGDKSKVTTVKDASGNPLILYKDSALPKTYDEEMGALGPELIYENQLEQAASLAADWFSTHFRP